jgi:hypothetical protein
MKWLTPYRSIKGYLERFTIISIGKIHIRFHRILSTDATTYYHSHPFNYLTIPITGSYIERFPCGKMNRVSMSNPTLHNSDEYHRIERINGVVRTLFITWGNHSKWSLKGSNPNIQEGLHKRTINGKYVYCKFDKFWYIGNKCPVIANNEARPSIYQNI